MYCLHLNYTLLHCPLVFSAGALIFGCTVALCFLIRDLMFYVIGESCVVAVIGVWTDTGGSVGATR